MGKRKDRRLAAMVATARRVKVDLFAEPSGEGGGSVQDEVGREGDPKNRAGLPNSPSSSGQRPENPLLLLGQYSDEELEDESSKGPNHKVVQNFIADFDEQVKLAVEKRSPDVNIDLATDVAVQKVETLGMENGSAAEDDLQVVSENGDTVSNVAESGDLLSAISDVQVGEYMSFGWKMVLHEESQRYYYWNTVTGETSWAVPDVLTQGADMNHDMKIAADSEQRGTVNADGHESNSALQVELIGATDATKEINKYVPKRIVSSGHEDEILCDGKGDHDANPSNLKSSSDLGLHDGIASDAETGKFTAGDNEVIETQILTSRLVKNCEYLLQRLNSLKGPNCHLGGLDLLSKYLLEVEIRLSDIKSLLSCGASLLPFWVHSERQLKQLEVAINDEAYLFHYKPQGDDIKADAYLENAFHSTTKVEKDLRNENHGDATINAENGLTISTMHPGIDVGKKYEVCETAVQDESTPRTVLHSGEDIDMDVDMEVEDANQPNSTSSRELSIAQFHGLTAPEAESIPLIPPTEQSSFSMEEMHTIPLPPDEDWIPPPPPDNELVPPPPPDEPPESSYPPPPDSEAIQPFSYTEQYPLSYPASSFDYYGQTNTEVLGSNLYGHAEGSQIAVSQIPPYYAAVPSVYHNAPAVVSSVEHVAYYGLQDGSAPSLTIGAPGDSSGLGALGSDQSRSIMAHAEPLNTSLMNDKASVSVVDGNTEHTFLEVPMTAASIEAPAITSVMEIAPVSSSPAVTSVSPSAAAVPKNKVSRVKKRTAAVVSNLRSNKKVSSLVDKWKAAKEELHEEEENEPDNAYEVLEKKRQREIEEWHTQQIASGEAKDNANFQPLGGDWRDRVKRKRAQLENEAVQSPSEGATDGNQQPDLNELSTDLPSGWQAYWDDSSKQVYYGNVATQETTWIRPTN